MLGRACPSRTHVNSGSLLGIHYEPSFHKSAFCGTRIQPGFPEARGRLWSELAGEVTAEESGPLQTRGSCRLPAGPHLSLRRRPCGALIVCHVAAEPLVPWTIIPGPVSLLYESPAAAVPTSTNLAASCNSDLVWWSPRGQVSRAQGFIPPGGSSGQSFPRRVQLPGPQPASPRPLL